MQQNVLGSRKQLSNLLFLSGILGLAFGGLHLSTFFSSSSSTALSDAGFNAGLGLVELLCGWLVAKGKLLAFPVAAAIILASLIYSYMMGRGSNFVSLIVGGVFLTWLIFLWRRGELA